MLGNYNISQNIVKSPKKKKREIRIKFQRMKESIRKQKALVTEKIEVTIKCFYTFNNDKDEQYPQFFRKIKKSNAIPLFIPKNIGKNLAPTAS